MEEISAAQRGRGDKIVSDNSKCIRTSEGGRGVNFQFLRGGGIDVFWNDPLHPDAPYFSILICLTPDDFTRQGESTGA
jgi:hypothetical protein